MNLCKQWKIGALLLVAGTAHLAAAAPSASTAPEMTRPIASLVTSYAKMTHELRTDVAASPLLTMASLGKSTQGKDLWMVRAAQPGLTPDKTVRVLFLCRQHGDEPASTEAVLGLLGRLAQGKEPDLRSQLSRTTFYFIPMVNPDGADANTRRNGVGADLNRDWGKFAQPETRAVDAAAKRLAPNVVIDAHNWDGDDPYNANCIEAPRDRESAIAEATRTVQSEAAMALSQNGFQINATAYGPQADPRLAHRYFTAKGIVSALVETHSGDPGDVADFIRRQGVYVGLIHALAGHLSVNGTKARLDALENIDDDRAAKVMRADREIFAASAPVAGAAPGHKAHRAPRWLPVLLAFAVALWALFQGRASLEMERPAPRYRFCRKSWLRAVPGSRAAAVHAIRPSSSRVAVRPSFVQDASRRAHARRDRHMSIEPEPMLGFSGRLRYSSMGRRSKSAPASSAPSASLRDTLLCPR